MTSVNGVPAAAEPHIGVLLDAVAEAVRARFAAEDGSGLRQSHYRLLSRVPADGTTITDLAARLGMTKQAGGQFVGFLVGTGHLRVEPDPADRRVRMVRRTPLGVSAVAEATARFLRLEREWAQRVGPSRYTAMREVLIEITRP